MSEPRVIPDLVLTEAHLVTLEAICDLFEATNPEPGSSMRLQIDTTRKMVARFWQGGTGEGTGYIQNHEIVKVEVLSRVAHITVNDPIAEKWRRHQEHFGLHREEVNDLWETISGIMAAFIKYGPDGDLGPN